MEKDKKNEFVKELTSLINKYSRENVSNTPDFVLAEYLMACLDNFDVITNIRTAWFGEIKEKEIFEEKPIELKANKI